MTPVSEAGEPGQPFVSEAAVRATILVSMQDRARRHSLVVELVLRAHRAHLAGATVFEGREGFGESGRVHRTHTLSDDAPVSVVIIDRRERIEQFLGDVAELLEHVLVVLDDVDVVRI
ncbi:MAG: DUF190 domain-containing protein [Acidimicrobiales bacterium]